MYNGINVLDVHAHMSVQTGANATLAQLLGSNTPRSTSLLKAGKGLPSTFRITDDNFHWAAANHVQYIDDRNIDGRNIDVQVIGPAHSTTWHGCKTTCSIAGAARSTR